MGQSFKKMLVEIISPKAAKIKCIRKSVYYFKYGFKFKSQSCTLQSSNGAMKWQCSNTHRGKGSHCSTATYHVLFASGLVWLLKFSLANIFLYSNQPTIFFFIHNPIYCIQDMETLCRTNKINAVQTVRKWHKEKETSWQPAVASTQHLCTLFSTVGLIIFELIVKILTWNSLALSLFCW